MEIRTAREEDFGDLVRLLEALNYPMDPVLVKEKIKKSAKDPDDWIFVMEAQGQIQAFLELHFIPQLGLPGDIARISYFSVAAELQGRGLGTRLLEHVIGLARARGCDRMEVHCHTRRTAAHRFYESRGFRESPKYFILGL
jgi:GNAT superfamily N-acetyltransferase